MNEATLAQIRAARPDASSWVAANAGSGKTKVLTDRVARLLLSGTPPQRILCLTYTKAAAAEMQNRLFQTLGTWAMLDDGPLREALGTLGTESEYLGSDHLDAARRLFAKALETPGGLKIQTIHAFCEVILRRFPLEAGVAPQFQVLEDRQAKALRTEVLDTLASTLPCEVGDLVRFLPGDDPDALLSEIGRQRAAFSEPFDAATLAGLLGADPNLNLADLAERTVSEIDLECLRAFVPILAGSTVTDNKTAAGFEEALGATAGDRLVALERVLLTGESAAAPFAAKIGKVPTKAIRAEYPALAERLDELMMRIETARGARLATAAYQKSATLNQFGRIWIEALDARKAAAGLLDFDDMIDRTRRMLLDPGVAAWVLWRLDGGIDHVLVDEAQDTSPAQWQVVRAVSEEFFAGESARRDNRTIFVVGDEKQSIYSFQGADPGAFGLMRDHYREALDHIGQALESCDLIHSFRSARPVLALVDAVFAGPAGIGLAIARPHEPFFEDLPGRVEVWPFLPKPEKVEEPRWYMPVDTRSADDPVEVMARRIARELDTLLRTGAILPDPVQPRPVRAGDVMILVQRRGALFEAVIRELKKAGVPVAGADLLRMGGELAVRDLLAACRIAATPGDDLSLAALLRSPLGETSEVALFSLAHGRPGTLHAALRSRPEPGWQHARDFVEDLIANADFLRPYEMLQRVLIRHDGRRRLVARLGIEAEDGIDALLDLALAYERTQAPSLTGFLAWIDRDEIKVKRRLEDDTDQVRVMTVHGAKGLEANIVILPDTGARQEGRNAPEILRLDGEMAVWKMPIADSPKPVREAEQSRRDKARAESMRLLYVALTRACRWLIVCGAGTEPKPDSGAWYPLVRAAIEELSPDSITGTDSETKLILTHRWEIGAASAGMAVPDRLSTPLPTWVQAPAPVRSGPPRANSPSRLGGAHVLEGASEEGTQSDAMERGDAIHRLIEALAGQDPAKWPELARHTLPDDEPDLEAILQEAEAVLTAPALADLFGPGSLAEVDVTANLAQPAAWRMLGRIDRLLVTSERILAVDFKSNRAIPERPEFIPEGILRQLGAYRAALCEIWRDRRVDVAVVWTRGAILMPVPAHLVDAALARAAP